MSNPGESPNNLYARPQQPAYQPGYQQPVPPQANPYTQQPPQPYGQPPAPYAPADASGGRRGKPWLWALVGVVAASLAWGGAAVALGGFGGAKAPGTGGYTYAANLCDKTDFGPLSGAGYTVVPSSRKSGASSAHRPSMDAMQCNVNLAKKQTGTTGTAGASSAWFSETVLLHKKTDPKTEFADSYGFYASQKTDTYHFTVSDVAGLGEQAFLVTQVYNKTDSGNTVYEILGVRDHGMTFQLTWSSYDSSSTSKLTASHAAELLEQSAKSTLAKLR